MSVNAPGWVDVRCDTAGCGTTMVAKVRWVDGQGQIEVEWRCRRCHHLKTQLVTRE